ncbi:hypothetical protein [Synechococcus sp. KORDI-52]|uniref:hypothetical protein n=1 Tax=Synechococcus sp. KORDI-52 TaxID=585425 RepID=UPI000AFEBA44|nr:hypothetical protein [Synechococcus sp. KORDI-52]
MLTVADDASQRPTASAVAAVVQNGTSGTGLSGDEGLRMGGVMARAIGPSCPLNCGVLDRPDDGATMLVFLLFDL